MTGDVHFVVPGSLDQRTGGYIYGRRLVDALRADGQHVTVHELPGRFPMVDADARLDGETTLSRLPDRATVVIDGLALPAVAGALWAEQRRLRIVLLVHHPLSLETGVDPAVAATLRHMETGALALAARIVVTSPFTRSTLVDDFAVRPARIGVVLPGTDPAPPAPGSGEPAPVILALATLTPRKGHLVLLDALARLADRPWRLVCAGSLDRDPATTEAVRSRIAAHGIADRVTLAGELDGDALAAVWAKADVFVMPSFYEGYGMAVAEALARGMPVVTTTGGALGTTVPDGAAVKVPPGDAGAFAEGLGPLLADPAVRRAWADKARAAGAALPDWPAQARAFVRELESVA